MMMKKALTTLAKKAYENPIIFTRNFCGYALGEKSFVKNSLLNNPELNQLGMYAQRVKLAYQLAQHRRKKLEKYLDPDDINFFYQHGYICKENFLPEAEFLALRQEIMQAEFETREMLQGNTVTRRMALDANQVSHLPKVTEFIHHPEWNALLNFVSSFKVQAMHYIQVIFAKVNQELPDPQTNFHSDTFYSSAKAWLFLTDVDEHMGPFMYVPGSHRADEKRLAWEQYKSVQISTDPNADELSRRGSFRISANELEQFGFAKPIKFTVKANTLLIADTFGFHARAEATETATRIELWSYARRNPMLPFVGGHYLSMPYLKRQTVSSYWKVLDILEKNNLKRSPWRPLGRLKVQDEVRIKTLEDQNR